MIVSVLSKNRTSYSCEKILSVAVFCSIIIVALSCIIGGVTASEFHYSTCALVILIQFLLFLPMQSKNEGVVAVGSVVAILSLIYILPRAVSFFVRYLYVDFPLSVTIGFEQIDNGLAFIALGLAAFVSGLFTAGWLAEKFLLAPTGKKLKLTLEFADCFFSLTVFLIIHYLVQRVFGFSAFNNDAEVRGNNLLAVVSMVFTPYMGLLIITGCLIVKRSRGDKVILQWGVVLILFVLEQALAGSRAGGLAVLIATMFGYVVAGRCFKDKSIVYVSIVVCCVLASFVSFQLGSTTRLDLMNGRHTMPSASSITPSASSITPSASSAAILTRLYAPLDTAILSINLNKDFVLDEKLLNIGYCVRSAINILVPGVVFEDAQLNVSQAWPFVFKMRDVDLINVKYYYESFVWTSFGFFYSVFGWVGVCVFFAFGMIFVFAWLKITYAPDFLRLILMMWLCSTIGSFMFMMSLDDWLVMTVFNLVSASMFVVLSHLFKLIRNELFVFREQT